MGSPGVAVALCVRVLWTPGAVRRSRECRGAEPLLGEPGEQGSLVLGVLGEQGSPTLEVLREQGS
jgi:hypothetical protein